MLLLQGASFVRNDLYLDTVIAYKKKGVRHSFLEEY